MCVGGKVLMTKVHYSNRVLCHIIKGTLFIQDKNGDLTNLVS